MKFELVGTTSLQLQTQLQWLWYSERSKSFVAGDERGAFVLPVSNPGTAKRLEPARTFDANTPHRRSCNLPIPGHLLDELLSESWHGFRFLRSGEYDHALDESGHPVGDLLRTLVFGPDYGLYIEHPAGGVIFSLRSGSMTMLRRSGNTFEQLDQTKTRGRAALAFAAHPTERLIAYGDNYGTFHAHSFDDAGFSKASKIAGKERKASRLEFARGGNVLIIAGMGYLASYSYSAGGKFAPAHEQAMAVRDFLWLEDQQLVVVNHGLQGISAWHLGENGFEKLGELKTEGAVQQIAASKDLRYLAVSVQDHPAVSVFAIAFP